MRACLTTDTIAVVRRLLLAVVLLGILVTTADLLLLEHYENLYQQIPLALNAVAVAIVSWHMLTGSRSSVRALQGIMVIFVLASCVGVYLHFQDNLEFQLEIDPAQGRWALFKRVMRAKAPPALAPGAMAQLGLIGLVLTYRHPTISRDRGPE